MHFIARWLRSLQAGIRCSASQSAVGGVLRLDELITFGRGIVFYEIELGSLARGCFREIVDLLQD